MALRNLSTEAMIALSDAWLDTKRPARKLLEQSELTMGLVPRLAAVHKQLVVSLRQGPPFALAATLAGIRQEQSVTDARHDRKARGIFMVLSGMAELAEEEGAAAQLVSLRDLLFPKGTSIVTRSYIEEAGEAKLVLSRLTEEAHRTLESLPSLGKRTLADEVDAWIGAGERLGKLEQKRASAEAAMAATPASLTPAMVSRARALWMRVVTALVNNLSLDDEPQPGVTEHILKPLEDAELKADRSSGARCEGHDADPSESGAPEPPAKAAGGS